MNSSLLINDLLSRADKGSDNWWQDVATTGTPLQRQLANGDIEVTFLWRDPEGNAAQSDYQKVYLDIYSHTPHPTQQLTSMERDGNSDIWLWKTKLPNDWCGSYFLMPAKSNQLPPVAADRNMIRGWWIGLMETAAQADPLNVLPTHNNGNGLLLSRIQLTQAQVHPVWQLSAASCNGKLQQFCWRSEQLHTERDIWIYCTDVSATQQDLPLIILLDGHYWARHTQLFSALDVLTASNQLPPAVYLFIDAVSPAQRTQDLPCNENFWLAVQQELLLQVFALQPFTKNPQRTAIVGQSFGGLSALYAALHWPVRFAVVLSQSGSFWWPDPDETGAEGSLTHDVIAGLCSNKKLTIFLQVGCYESDMIAVNRAMHNALQLHGHKLHYREFRGGHDWICWRDGLLTGLIQLMNSLPIASNTL